MTAETRAKLIADQTAYIAGLEAALAMNAGRAASQWYADRQAGLENARWELLRLKRVVA